MNKRIRKIFILSMCKKYVLVCPPCKYMINKSINKCRWSSIENSMAIYLVFNYISYVKKASNNNTVIVYIINCICIQLSIFLWHMPLVLYPTNGISFMINNRNQVDIQCCMTRLEHSLWKHPLSGEFVLTHWGRETHIWVSKLTMIGSDNGLLPGGCQAIIWTNAEILLIGHMGTNFSETLIEIYTFSFKKMHFKISFADWWIWCIGLNVLIGVKTKSMKKRGHGHLAKVKHHFRSESMANKT